MSDKNNLVDPSSNGAYDTAYSPPPYSPSTNGYPDPAYRGDSVQSGQDMFYIAPTTMPTTVEMQSTVTSNDMYRQAELDIPPNYIGHNIFNLLCCSMLFGIIGLVKGSQVSTLYMSGNHAAAQVASLSARFWYKVGLVVGTFVKAFLIAYVVVYYAI